MFKSTTNEPRGGPDGGRDGAGVDGAGPATPPQPDMLTQVQGKEAAYEGLTGLPFHVRTGSQTAFDHTTDPGTVILGVGQLQKLGVVKQSHIDFICLHELGHFKELSDDPVGYRSVIDEGKRADGLGQSYFRFYNALLDIYVNRNTANRAPVYGDGRGGFSPEIRELYTQHLFKDRDLTSLPKSTQYSYALLNIGMGTGGDLTVSPEVRDALDKPLKHLGRELTTSEIIETFLVPAIGVRATREWRATVTERKSVIDKTCRKRFEELVSIDKAEGRNPNQGSPGGDIEGVEPSIGDLDKAVERAREIQKEANKSAEEKAADQREKAAADQARKHLSEEEAKDLAETHRRVYAQILQVADIFREIVRTEVDHRKEQQGFFKSGQELDVAEAVERFHTIQTNPGQARVFTRDTYAEVLTEQPQHVRVWGVFDLSGSMSGDIKLVRELSVIFSGATQTISVGAELEQHSLKASFASVGYNDDAFEILPLTDNPTYADIAQSYRKLQADGGTYEAPALRMVADRIDKLERSESVVDIVVVITDGETKWEEESREVIKKLQELGAKLMAFQFSRGYIVPDVKPTEGPGPAEGMMPFARPEPESGTFGRIWGPHGFKVRKADQVVPAVREGLRELLRKG